MNNYLMRIILSIILGVCFFQNTQAQTINLNESFIQQNLRTAQLLGKFDPTFSFTSLPIHTGEKGVKIDPSLIGSKEYGTTLKTFLGKYGTLKILPVDFLMEYSSHHPYSRNNGSMIPNRGYQQLVSFGFFAELGPLSIQFKPESVYAENRNFNGFPDSHYDAIWSKRYILWNKIDLPERFGEKAYKKSLFGQSSIRLNYQGLSLGLSSENIWWGPSVRNSIMMSNQAQGFNHITFDTTRPVKTFIGNFEWQLVTGRLEASGFRPPEVPERFGSNELYFPKNDDWRYYQGLTITYSPKWVKGLSLGLIRWVQFYGEFAKINRDYFPVFAGIFRDDSFDYTNDVAIDQAGGVFARWLWQDAKAEIYTEYHMNDSKYNLRDLVLDMEHSRAYTIGLRKVFQKNISSKIYELSWERTRMQPSSSRRLRGAGSWYGHGAVRHGYTNNGEVMGAGIGPGSNSQYFELAMIDKLDRYGIAFELIEQDNDFLIDAFDSGSRYGDYRRYWKDLNVHLSVQKKIKKFWGRINLVYSRSLNYQWELEDFTDPYYHAGTDVNNFHINFNLTYHFNFKQNKTKPTIFDNTSL
ncbi:capsule assembly Wzi family protein [Flavobacteriaceae bacterium]|nr:capsule assembly Wzi family protein [Flavobacteriaceae bacterium]MDC0382354.1 capsule assembly Wzi family protein [Flavobacteriaceae bacterium]